MNRQGFDQWTIMRRSEDRTCVRREGESPEDYRARQLADVQDNWKLLCDAGRSSLMNHITTCDLPETFSTYQDIALKKGYKEVKCLCTTPDELAKCVVLCA